MPYGNLLADVVQGSTANTPPVFKDGNGTTIGTLCRAWVNFNGTGTVAIRASFNVSSITDNGTGAYTVNFTTAMPDINYTTTTTVSQVYGISNMVALVNIGASNNEVAPTTSAVSVASIVPANGAYADVKYFNIAVFR
jgi:hypothetical protein